LAAESKPVHNRWFILIIIISIIITTIMLHSFLGGRSHLAGAMDKLKVKAHIAWRWLISAFEPLG